MEYNQIIQSARYLWANLDPKLACLGFLGSRALKLPQPRPMLGVSQSAVAACVLDWLPSWNRRGSRAAKNTHLGCWVWPSISADILNIKWQKKCKHNIYERTLIGVRFQISTLHFFFNTLFASGEFYHLHLGAVLSASFSVTFELRFTDVCDFCHFLSTSIFISQAEGVHLICSTSISGILLFYYAANWEQMKKWQIFFYVYR